MRKAPYLLAVVAISGLALTSVSSSATPPARGLAAGSAILPVLSEGLVQKVQMWSCRERRRDMTPEQRRFCDGYGDYYDDYGDYGPDYGYSDYDYGYPGYGIGIVPFLSFGFGDRHRHHHHHGKWRD